MLGRCMAIFQHFKTVAWGHSDLLCKNANLEKQIQELPKEKSERDSNLKSVEMASLGSIIAFEILFSLELGASSRFGP